MHFYPVRHSFIHAHIVDMSLAVKHMADRYPCMDVHIVNMFIVTKYLSDRDNFERWLTIPCHDLFKPPTCSFFIFGLEQ